MLPYYGILTASVILFGVQFFFSSRYQKENGNGPFATFTFTCLSSLAGLIWLLAFNGFRLEFTPFTLLMASLASLNSILYSVCSLKALGRINLSLYSLFSMLGGMLLPFVVGILFYHEPVTVGKLVCLALILPALLCTVQKTEQKGEWIYYAGIFTLNGMSGVLATLFSSAPYEKTNAASYSVWSAIVTLVVSLILLTALALIKRGDPKRPNLKAVLFGLGGGSLSQVANFMLLIALAVLPASVQYPFVTGGVMIVSTIISAITGKAPSKRELLALTLSFLGIMALVLIPV